MIAIFESCGAFVYGCTAKQADERINHNCGGLDYDEKGNRRDSEGMIAWLIMDKDIVFNLIKLGCEAIYVNRCYRQGRDFLKVDGLEEMGFLDTVLRKIVGRTDNDAG